MCLETIGKGIGWDIEAALSEGDYRHICEQLSFLEKSTEKSCTGNVCFIRTVNGKQETAEMQSNVSGGAAQSVDFVRHWECRGYLTGGILPYIIQQI